MGTKMNYLDHSLELVLGHVNHCVTLAIDISETVRDRGLVPKDHQWEMTTGESNRHVTDDVTLSQKVKL